MASFVGHLARVKLIGRNPVAIALATNEPWTDTGDRTDYRITDLDKQYLDPNVTVGSALVVERDPDGVSGFSTVAAADYTVQHVGGHIVFNSQNGVGAVVRTQTGAYLPAITIGGSLGWTLDVEGNQNESTDLETIASAGAWRTFLTGIRQGSGSLERLWNDDAALWLDQLNDTAAQTLALSLYFKWDASTPETAQQRFECFANIVGISEEVTFEDLIGEDVQFNADGQIYLRSDAGENA